MTDRDARIARMLDKDEIRDVLACYARGVDRGDGPLLGVPNLPPGVI